MYGVCNFTSIFFLNSDINLNINLITYLKFWLVIEYLNLSLIVLNFHNFSYFFYAINFFIRSSLPVLQQYNEPTANQASPTIVTTRYKVRAKQDNP